MGPGIAEDEDPEPQVRSLAFGWLAAHRDRFLALDPASRSRELFARKAFVELALLVGLASRARERVDDGVYATLLGCLTSVAARRSYRELVARDRSAMLLYASTCGALRLAGLDDPEFRWCLEQLVGGRYATAVERLPFRHLDLLHTLDTAGIPHTLPSVQDTLPFTILVADPNVVEIDDVDAYAVTHTLFYASDFGARQVPWPAGYDAGRAIELLNALLVIYRMRGNADLVAELICSLACLNVHGTPEVARAWRFLAEMQRADGRVPGPEGVVSPELLDEDPAARDWLTSYHTTMVVAAAGLMTKPHVMALRPAPSRTPTNLRQAVQRGVDWVAGESPRWTPDAAVPALAAAGMASRRIGGSPALSRELVRFVGAIDAGGEPDWSELGGEVVLGFALVLREHGLSCRSLQRFLTALSQALAEHPALPQQAAPVARALLELEVLPAVVPHLVSGATSPLSALRDLRNRPVELAGALTSLTAAQRAELDADAPEWVATAESLALALADAIREYRLGEAAALLRGLLVLGWGRNRIVVDAVDMLLRQQTLEGAFGYTASDDDHARATDQRRWTQSLLLALSEVDECLRA